MADNEDARTSGLSRYRARSLKTLRAMVQLYCDGHGHGTGDGPCPQCAALLRYSTRRLERCVFGDAKPNCADCRVHCYRAEMREQIRRVMRWAGPRMLLRHPVLTVAHMIAAHRPVPGLPARGSRPAGAPSAEVSRGTSRR